MSTRFDILDAKAYYERHSSEHQGCRSGCPERARLYEAYMTVAGHWGIEPGDRQRQAEQAAERVPGGPGS
jgi:hypothetical protein